MEEDNIFFHVLFKGIFFLEKSDIVNKNMIVLKLTVMALLSAIGVILMSYVQIPYPIAPFLKIEISDFVVIFAFLLFGFKEALIVAVVNSLGDLLFRGPEGPYAIGQIVAFIASITYVLGMWIVNLIFKKNNFGFKVLKYSLVVMMVSIVMCIANYFILTPIYLGHSSFLDVSNDALASITGVNSYLLSIIVLYFPFNFLKGTLISIIGVGSGDSLLHIFNKKIKLKSEDDDHEDIT